MDISKHEKISAHAIKFPNMRICPCCGNKNDFITSGKLSYATPNSGKPTPNTVVAIICQSCGLVRHFACAEIGI